MELSFSWKLSLGGMPAPPPISVLIHGTQVGREKREKKDGKGDLEDSPLPPSRGLQTAGPCLH